jgi:hypothetical protein
LIFKILYLKKLQDKQYWEQIEQIMKNSNVFWMTTLRAISPNWWRHQPFWYIKHVLRKAM